jgi:hypothetical protein
MLCPLPRAALRLPGAIIFRPYGTSFWLAALAQWANAQHERRGPAAAGQRTQTELNGWSPSAPRC